MRLEEHTFVCLAVLVTFVALSPRSLTEVGKEDEYITNLQVLSLLGKGTTKLVTLMTSS